jgi:hypothetical protein
MAAPVIKLRRSAVEGAIPTTSQLALGELAINTFDGKLFIKKNNGTESIVEIGAGDGGEGGGTPGGTDTQIQFNDGGSLFGGDAGLTYNKTNQSVSVNGSILISDSQLKTTTTTRTSSTDQFTADSFTAASYRTTKYLIEVRETSTSNFYSSEILLMHDGTSVYITEYGTLQTATSPVSSIDADLNSSNVRLLITPSVSNTITKVYRISLTS